MKFNDISKKADWSWIKSVTAVKVGLRIELLPIELDLAASPGFLRIVDQNAILLETPRNGELHRSLSNIRRHHDIRLQFQTDGLRSEVYIIHGVGSIGHASSASHHGKTPCVNMRITALSVRCKFA